MRIVLAIAMLAGCFEQHAPATTAIVVRDCYTCHRPDYEVAPNHATRSTTCANCHRLRDWIGLEEGTHPEAMFPITSGKHRDILCADCHDPEINPDSTVRTPISALEPALQPDNVVCTNCHAHEPARMAAKHDEIRLYAPAKCRSCHKLGLHED
ncbi:MAG TPA: cytochrome c3 family protein [Kofleriaceae bacterium]